MPTEIIVALIGGTATILAAIITVRASMRNRGTASGGANGQASPAQATTPPRQSSGRLGAIEGPDAAEKEPQIHIVDPLYGGDYLTISAAVEAAAPGDTILVRPGIYEESLIIDKPGLAIGGEGDVDEIVVEATGSSVLQFRTTTGAVRNLTVRQLGEGESWTGVEIVQGQLLLTGCDISSRSARSCYELSQEWLANAENGGLIGDRANRGIRILMRLFSQVHNTL